MSDKKAIFLDGGGTITAWLEIPLWRVEREGHGC